MTTYYSLLTTYYCPLPYHFSSLRGRAKCELLVDGQRFMEIPHEREARFCRDDSSSSLDWSLCADADGTCVAANADAEEPTNKLFAACCRLPYRSADVAPGPVRRVLSAPVTLVCGTTHSSAKFKESYRKAALSFANAWQRVGGGSARIVADSEMERDIAAWPPGNLIMFGGPASNSVADFLAPHQPILTVAGAMGTKKQVLVTGP